MRHSDPEEFLGVDVGAARVGIARGSGLARLAEPLKTVAAGQAVGELIDLVSANQAGAVVVGLPRNLDGKDTRQTQYVRDWVREAKTKVKLPFYWQDEALTSRQAAGKIQNSKFKHQSIDEHSVAAAIILQDFLNADKDDRVKA